MDLQRETTVQRNKLAVRRYFDEIWNQGNLSAAHEFVASDVVGHAAAVPLSGLDVLRERVALAHRLYGDLHFAVENLVAEGDYVAARWTMRGVHHGSYMGRPAAGKVVSVTGMNLFRFSGNHIVELWANTDDLGELQQLGVLSLPEQGNESPYQV